MNVVREIERINARELELNVPDNASWHAQYAHSAYIFIAALDNELTEGDVICVFSQFGEVVDCNLVRDRQTGKSRGFAFLAYEDQRSCVLAIDNMNGAKLLSRTLRVDHADRYRRPKEEEKRAAGGRGTEEDEYKQFEEGGAAYDERRKRIWDFERWPPLAATQRVEAVMGGARRADTQMGAANAITSYTATMPSSTEDKQAAKIVAMWEERKKRKERQEDEQRRKEREDSRRGGRHNSQQTFGDQLLDESQDGLEPDRRERGNDRTADSGKRGTGRNNRHSRRRSRSRSRSRSPTHDDRRKDRHRKDRDKR